MIVHMDLAVIQRLYQTKLWSGCDLKKSVRDHYYACELVQWSRTMREFTRVDSDAQISRTQVQGVMGVFYWPGMLDYSVMLWLAR